MKNLEVETNCPKCQHPFKTEVEVEEPTPASAIHQVDPDLIKKAVESALPEGLGDFCTRFPGMCQKVDELHNDRHTHPVPGAALLTALTDCPECEVKLKEEFLPLAAEKYGYALKEPVPAPAQEPAAEVEEETKAEGEEPAQEEVKEESRTASMLSSVYSHKE